MGTSADTKVVAEGKTKRVRLTGSPQEVVLESVDALTSGRIRGVGLRQRGDSGNTREASGLGRADDRRIALYFISACASLH